MNDFREQTMSCWLGKAAGGTLGQPFEGCDGPLHLKGYDPVPEDMTANDDLDLQVLWACILNAMEKPRVDRELFARGWLEHVDFPWDEYGLALRNLRRGIPPPYSGAYDNWFQDSLGAAIRSELWACLAPGNPALAAAYAYEDACVDHAGDGIYAAQFLAALESAAFVENRIAKLLEIGLSVIPEQSRLAKALRDCIRHCAQCSDWQRQRQRILELWGSENFTDAVMNLCFVVMALLLGKGDFGKTICIAANCGRDTDCTAASAGAILGIINPAGIGPEWLRPIGRKLILSPGIRGITAPDSLDEFSDMIVGLRKRLLPSVAKPEPGTADFSAHAVHAQCAVLKPWFAQDANRFPVKLPAETRHCGFSGNFGCMPAEHIPPDSLFLMRFSFTLEESAHVRVMFNTPANCRVWLDGVYQFGRAGGRMAPSFHRCPINQYKDLWLAAGEHELLAGIASDNERELIEWVFGVGDLETKQWMTAVKYH
ncbi:MAG: ADP-ribosylglycohydrolase family protein [Lentisphaeria bacterium]|nr:ADP-ribosylglycohydrolase family protein [Lentisphaeria bacterium]MDY0177105.1 ADP-ribosylglycohydrolase family protein [Lentisphaeria bacterium]